MANPNLGNNIARDMLKNHSVRINSVLAYVAKFGGSHDLLDAIEEIKEEQKRGETKLTPAMSKRLKSLETTLTARFRPGQAIGNAGTVKEALPVFRQGQQAIFNNAYVEMGGKVSGFEGGKSYQAIMNMRKGLDTKISVPHSGAITRETSTDLWRRRTRLYGELRVIDPETGSDNIAKIRKELAAIDDALETHYSGGIRGLLGGELVSESTEYMAIKNLRRARKSNQISLDPFTKMVREQQDGLTGWFEARGYDLRNVSQWSGEVAGYRSVEEHNAASRLFDLYHSAMAGHDMNAFNDAVTAAGGHDNAAEIVGNMMAVEYWKPEMADAEYHTLGLVRMSDGKVVPEDAMGNPNWVTRDSAQVRKNIVVIHDQIEDGYGLRKKWADQPFRSILNKGHAELTESLRGVDDRSREVDSLYDSDIFRQIHAEQDRARTTLRFHVKYGGPEERVKAPEDFISQMVQMKSASRGNYTLTRLLDKEIRAFEEVKNVRVMEHITRQADRLTKMPRDVWKGVYLDLVAGVPGYDGTMRVARDASTSTAGYLRGKSFRYLGATITDSGVRTKVGLTFSSPTTVRLASPRDLVEKYMNMGEIEESTRAFERRVILREMQIVKRHADLKAKKVFGEAAYLVQATVMDPDAPISQARPYSVAKVFSSSEEASKWSETLNIADGFEIKTKRIGFREIARVQAGGEYKEFAQTRQQWVMGRTITPLKKRLAEEASEASQMAIRDFADSRTRDPLAGKLLATVQNLGAREQLMDFTRSKEFISAGDDPAAMQKAFVQYMDRMKELGKDVSTIADDVFSGLRVIGESTVEGRATMTNNMIKLALEGGMQANIDVRSNITYNNNGVARAMFDAAEAIVHAAEPFEELTGKVDPESGKMLKKLVVNRQLEKNIEEATKKVLRTYGFEEDSEIYKLFQRSLFVGNGDVSRTVQTAKSFRRQVSHNLSMWSETSGRAMSNDKAATALFGKKFDDLAPSMQKRVETFLRAYDESHFFLVDSLILDEEGSVLDVVKRSDLADMFGKMRDAINGFGYDDERSYRRLQGLLGSYGISASSSPEEIARVAAGVVHETGHLERVLKSFRKEDDSFKLSQYVLEYMEGDKYSGGSLEEIVDNAIYHHFRTGRTDKNRTKYGTADIANKNQQLSFADHIQYEDVDEAKRYAARNRRSFIDYVYDQLFGESMNAGTGSADEWLMTEAQRREGASIIDNMGELVRQVEDDEGNVRNIEVSSQIEEMIEEDRRALAIRYNEQEELLDLLKRREFELKKRFYGDKSIDKEYALQKASEIVHDRRAAEAEAESILDTVSRGGHSIEDFLAESSDIKDQIRETWEYVEDMSKMVDESLGRTGGTFSSGDAITTTAKFLDSLSADPQELTMAKFNKVLNEIIMPTYQKGYGDPDAARKALAGVFGADGENIEMHVVRASVRQADGQLKSQQVMILNNAADPNADLVAYKLTQLRDEHHNWRWRAGVLEGSEIVETVAERDVIALQDNLETGSIDLLNKVLTKLGREQNDVKRKMKAILPELIPDEASPTAIIAALQEHGNLQIPTDMSEQEVVETFQAALMGGERRGLLDQIVGGLVGGNPDELTDYDRATSRLIDTDKFMTSLRQFMDIEGAGGRIDETVQMTELRDAFDTLSQNTPKKFMDEMSKWMNKGNIKRNLIAGGAVLGAAALHRMHEQKISDNTETMLMMDHPGSESVTRVASNEEGYAGTVRGRRQPYGAVSPHGPESSSSLSSTIAIRDNLKNLTAADVDDILSQR